MFKPSPLKKPFSAAMIRGADKGVFETAIVISLAFEDREKILNSTRANRGEIL
jgi:hypothetical protein